MSVKIMNFPRDLQKWISKSKASRCSKPLAIESHSEPSTCTIPTEALPLLPSLVATAVSIQPNLALNTQDRYAINVSRGATDLWQAAYQSLTVREKDRLEESRSRFENFEEEAFAVDLVCQVVSQTKEWCDEREAVERHSKVTNGGINHGHTKASSIICSVLRFKEMIDAGMKFDTSGYAATAWSIISLGLTIVQNDSNRITSTLEAPAFLAEVLVRYAHIEEHHCDKQIRGSECLKECIISVYVAILQYTAEVMHSMRMGIGGRILHALNALTGEPLQQLKETITARDNAAAKWTSLMEHQDQKREFGELQEKANNLLFGVSDISHHLNRVEETVENEEEVAILTWLSPTNTFDKHEDTHQSLQKTVTKDNPDSGQWFLTSESLYEWRSSPNSFLWLYGNSGSGKSCLCSTVVEHLKALCSENTDAYLIYWYVNFNDQSTQNVQSMLCCFLRRLSAQVFVVLDAIDEYPEDSDNVKREDLLEVTEKLVQNGSQNLHVLVTSRAENDIKATLQRITHTANRLDVEGPLLVDLKKLFDKRMQDSPKLTDLDRHVKAQLEERLMEGEQKNFRWVALNLDNLQRCGEQDSSVQDALGRIPDSMEDMYLRVLAKIKDRDVVATQLIFQWLSVLERPLSREELVKAAKLDPPTDLNRLLPSSLVISSDVGPDHPETVRFAHSSVNEFLRSHKLAVSGPETCRFLITTGKSHAYVGYNCLRHLLDLSQVRDGSGGPKNPLLPYAAQHWSTHVKQAHCSDVDGDLSGKVRESTYQLFRPTFSTSFHRWLEIADPDKMYDGQARANTPENYAAPLYYAILLGLVEVSERLIAQDDVDVNGNPGQEGSPLRLAVDRGYNSVVQALLKKNVKLNSQVKIHGIYASATYAAAAQGNCQIVDMLLEAGASVDNVQGPNGTLLQAASYLGHVPIAERILDKGADLNERCGYFGSALEAACAAGHSEMVDFLLSKGARPNTTGGFLRSPLQAGVTSRHSYITKRLYSAGATHVSSSGILWWSAWQNMIHYMTLPPPMKHLDEDMFQFFQDKLKQGIYIPQGLKLDQQILAAANSRLPWLANKVHIALHKPSKQDVYLPPSLSFKLRLEYNGVYHADYIYCMLFWIGIGVFVVSPCFHFNPVQGKLTRQESLTQSKLRRIMEPLGSLIKIANNIDHYETIAFEGVAQDEVAVFKGVDEAHVMLQITIRNLCQELFKAEMTVIHDIDGSNPGGFSSDSEEPRLSLAERIDRIKEIDDDCKCQLAALRDSRLANMEQQLAHIRTDSKQALSTETADQMKDLRKSIEHMITTEARTTRSEMPRMIASQLSEITEATSTGSKDARSGRGLLRFWSSR
ncbi:hypothetical protein ACLMJK_005606 [Lecanora helva]